MKSVPKIKLNCAHCGTSIERLPYEAKKRSVHFCHRTCMSAYNRGRPLVRRDLPKYRCGKCTETLPREEFNWVEKQGKGSYRRGYCKKCESTSRKTYYTEHKDAEAANHRALRAHKLAAKSVEEIIVWWAKRKLASWRRRTEKNSYGEMNLTPEYILSLYQNQKGQCAYSGRPLVIQTFGLTGPYRGRNVMSLDRIDNNLGYVQGNVALCTYEANSVKGTLTVDELRSLCRDILGKLGT